MLLYRTAHVAFLIPRICIVFSIPFRHFYLYYNLDSHCTITLYRKPLDILYRFFSACFRVAANVIIVMHFEKKQKAMRRTVDPEAMFWNLDKSDVRRRDWTRESECGGGARGRLIDCDMS